MTVALALVAGIGIGALAVGLTGGDEAAYAPEPVAQVGTRVPGGAFHDEQADVLPPPEALPPEAERYPQYFQDLEGRKPDRPTELPTEIDYPRLDKLTAEPLSELPHDVVGAWDEDRESGTPGRRRAFVLVVEPTLSDADLLALLRDVRARHGDSPMLNVRVYDDPAAARATGIADDGAFRWKHLVGELQVNRARDLELIRVRKVRIDR